MSLKNSPEAPAFDPKAEAARIRREAFQASLGTPAASAAPNIPAAATGVTETPQQAIGSKFVPPDKKPDNTPEPILEGLRQLAETKDKHNEYFMGLVMAYAVLKNHFEHKKPKKVTNEISLMEYLGFNEENLTNIFIALFGKENTHVDQSKEIRAKMLLPKIKDFPDFVITQMFEIHANSLPKDIEPLIKGFGERLIKLNDLMTFSQPDKLNIIKTIATIRAQETPKKGGEKLILDEKKQIEIAIKCGIKSRLEPTLFDESFLKKTISDYHSDGRKLDVYPDDDQAQPAASPVAAPSSPVPDSAPQGEASPVVQPSEAPAAPSATPVTAPKSAAPETTSNGIDYKKLHRSRSVLRAVSRLQSLIEVLNSPDDAANIAKLTEITQSDANKDEKGIGKGLAYILLKLINDPEMDVILAKLAATFEIDDTSKLEEKVIQIDCEFTAKGIYPSES